MKKLITVGILIAAAVAGSGCMMAQANPSCSTCKSSCPKKIGRDKAIEIAFAHADVKKSDVRDLECELDRENGILVYDIEFEVGNMEYDYEINAATGEVVKAWKSRD